jgi:hypothetical protein
MIPLEEKEWNWYLAYLDDRGCLCEEDECICLSDKDFEDFITKHYEDLAEQKYYSLEECI